MELPERRGTTCLLLTREDAWALRELVLPYSAPSDTERGGDHSDEILETTLNLCKGIYDALLHIELEGRGEWNVIVSAAECFLINQFVKSGMWKGADALLVQTFMALHELAEMPALELPARQDVVIWETEEEVKARQEQT